MTNTIFKTIGKVVHRVTNTVAKIALAFQLRFGQLTCGSVETPPQTQISFSTEYNRLRVQDYEREIAELEKSKLRLEILVKEAKQKALALLSEVEQKEKSIEDTIQTLQIEHSIFQTTTLNSKKQLAIWLKLEETRNELETFIFQKSIIQKQQLDYEAEAKLHAQDLGKVKQKIAHLKFKISYIH